MEKTNPCPIQFGKSVASGIPFYLIVILVPIILLNISKKPVSWSLIWLGFWIVLWVAFLVWGGLYVASFKYIFGRNFTLKEGVISRSEKVLPYANIQHVIVSQRLFQRMLGIADVQIQTARPSEIIQGGAQQQYVISPTIPALLKEDADKVRNFIIAQVLKTKKGNI